MRRATGDYVDIDVMLLISIHALREESDSPARKPSNRVLKFQATLSVRRATSAWARRS